ncbi:MAG: hypothetical protein ABSB41_09615 [Anaerolineales bacterium]|jgi:hypothetical protein
MTDLAPHRTWPKRALSLLGWTRHSSYLLAAFVLVCGMIIYFWWPLALQVLAYIRWNGTWWRNFDWLLVGIYFAMTLLIMAHADLKRDALIIFVGTLGGLVIESWGTQTNLWFYFTAERPPLWIIPAWPIATLAIDRITRALNRLLPKRAIHTYRALYWLTFLGFYGLMLAFVAPTLPRIMTWAALLVCALFILTPTDHRLAFLIFLAGSGLGYFLELWGTTRQCWTYYTYQTPPLFAVLAHGMAAVSFWRAGLLVKVVLSKVRPLFFKSRARLAAPAKSLRELKPPR